MKTHVIYLFTILFISLFFFTNNHALPTFDSQGKALPTLAPMLEKVTPAVVNISTKGSYQGKSQLPDFLNDPLFRRFFHFDLPEHNQQQSQQLHALGSGVIVNAEKGYILTNNHVIDNASEILVTLKDGKKIVAELIGTDPQTDIAVLKINATNLIALKLYDSDKLRVGDFALAIGHPFGLDQTVTSGIVSGLGRNGLGIEGYEDFIQTDASINPGNSGGALVNLHGELIGINTAMFSKSGGNIGIGFAIPINMAKSVMSQLIQHGSIQRGMLGVQIQDLTPELASAIGTNASHGAIVSQVIANSAASKAGVKAGDIIIAVDDKEINNSSSLRNTIGLKRPDDKVKLTIIRGEKTLTIPATISGVQTISSIDSKQHNSSVFKGQKLHPALQGASLGQSNNAQGIIVLDVETQSPAWRSGLRADDLIVAINRREINSLNDLNKLADTFNKNKRQTLALNIHRGRSALLLVIR